MPVCVCVCGGGGGGGARKWCDLSSQVFTFFFGCVSLRDAP
jgi:hypothetical protein